MFLFIVWMSIENLTINQRPLKFPLLIQIWRNTHPWILHFIYLVNPRINFIWKYVHIIHITHILAIYYNEIVVLFVYILCISTNSEYIEFNVEGRAKIPTTTNNNKKRNISAELNRIKEMKCIWRKVSSVKIRKFK